MKIPESFVIRENIVDIAMVTLRTRSLFSFPIILHCIYLTLVSKLNIDEYQIFCITIYA